MNGQFLLAFGMLNAYDYQHWLRRKHAVNMTVSLPKWPKIVRTLSVLFIHNHVLLKTTLKEV